MEMRLLDMDTYPRKSHFEHFLSMQNPFLGITVSMDVTRLHRLCAARNRSFFLAFLHLSALAFQDIPEFRQRIHGQQIVEYSGLGTSHIEMGPDGVYTYCSLVHDLPWDQFWPYAESVRARCREHGSIEESSNVDAEIFVTCLPWLHYTQFFQPTDPAVSNPSIAWGRFEEDPQHRLMMPVTVYAHPALVDGRHMAGLFSGIEERIRSLNEL